MNCNDNSCDNRETCTQLIPSSCVPFVGYISPTIAANVQCRPNIDDVLKAIQDLVDSIKTSLGDNTTLTPGCFTFTPATVQQSALNEQMITAICALQVAVADIPGVDPSTLQIPINLLCLQDPSCTPQLTYSLLDVLTKLVTAYCNLQTRVAAIETFLNL